MREFLKFCFKGSRNYLHSTDVFNTLLNLVGKDIKNINFSFYKRTNKNIILTDEKPSSKESLVFTFSFYKGEKVVNFYGLESEQVINCRYPYEESIIVKEVSLDFTYKCGSLKSLTKYSFIEHLVALTKTIHLNFFPNYKGKWFFAKMHLFEIPTDFFPLKFCLNQHLGTRLTQSSIHINNSFGGWIYFSLIGEK